MRPVGRIWTVGFVPVDTVAGIVSDRTEVTVVSSVLVRSMLRACCCQSKHAEPRLISPLPSTGVVMGERSRVFHVAKAGEGVVADPGLGVGSACSS